jgi:dihydropteroate synthase
MLALKEKLIRKSHSHRPHDIVCGHHILRLSQRTQVMGILNRTPDSFSDGGRFVDEDKAVAHVEQMVRDGADSIDIGGESTRPGSLSVSVGEELDRVIPIIRRVAASIDVPISIDTQKSEVAEAALEAGASLVNDISALRGDDRMKHVVAKYGVPVVLMHMKGTPRMMQVNPEYENLTEELRLFFKETIEIAQHAGIAEDKMIIDPGIGFGKTTAHNLSIIKDLRSLTIFKRPILIGTSRKSFIGKVLGRDVQERLMGTAASVAISIINGATIIRVHDIKEMVEVARLADAIRQVR